MCAICDFKVEFDVGHPQTLTVAVATRCAIDNGILGPISFDGPLGAVKQRLAAVESLKTLQRRMEAAIPRRELVALPDFYILFIESRTWGFFHPTENGFDPNCKPEPPRISEDANDEGDAVVVVADMTMQAILEGKLALEEAIYRRMLIVDASSPECDRLRVALDKSLPSKGFSRFTCGAVAADATS
jgi:hypothetical protein